MPKLLIILPLAIAAFFAGRLLHTPSHQSPKSHQSHLSHQSPPSHQSHQSPKSHQSPPTPEEILAAHPPATVTLLARFLPHATPADLQYLVDTAHADKNRYRYSTAWWHLLAHHWFTVDPAAAANFATLPEHDQFRRPLLLNAWASVAPHAAIAASAAFGDATVERTLVSIALTNPELVAELGAPYLSADTIDRILRNAQQPHPDPAIALESASEITSKTDRLQSIKNLFLRTANDDPHRALALAESIADDTERNLAIQGIARSLATTWKDPALFRTLHQQLPPNKERTQIATAAAKKWGAENSNEALAWANTSLAGPERDAMVAAVIHASQGDNKTAVLDYLDANGWDVDLNNSTQGDDVERPGGGSSGNSFGADSYRHLLNNAFSELAKTDPRSALSRLANVPDDELREDMLATVTEQWFTDDSASAATWLASVPAGYTDTSIHRTVEKAMKNWVAEDRQAARAFLSSTAFENPGLYKKILTAAIAADLSNPDHTASTLSWIETVPEESRAEIAPDLAYEIARENPAAAAEIAVLLGIQHQRENTLSRIATGLASTDAPAAAAWLEKLPPGAKSDSAFGSLSREWTVKEPGAASTWVQSLPDGSGKDHAIAGLVVALIGKPDAPSTDFHSALLWSSSISADSTRSSSQQDVARRWVENDAAGLAGFLARNPDLPPSAHQAIKQALGN